MKAPLTQFEKLYLGDGATEAARMFIATLFRQARENHSRDHMSDEELYRDICTTVYVNFKQR